MTLVEAVERIVQRAGKRDRMLVAWTEHELDVVGRYVPELLDRFERRFRNALGVAKYWRTVCHAGDKPDDGALVGYLDLIGYLVPESAGVGRAAATIRIVGDAFDRGRTAAQLTANQRQRWADLRDHNRHDCAGMRQVCLIATGEIASHAALAIRSRGRRDRFVADALV